MADLNYKIIGVNKERLENEIRHLRENSSTFRALEVAALAAGYTLIEIEMGAGLLSDNIADSTRINSTTRRIRINSDVTASWGVGGRQATVGEVIAHELAHAVVPTEYRQPGVYDFQENGSEGKWVRQQAGQVARDLRLPGPNNAEFPATRIPVNEVQGCTQRHPQGDGAKDGVLFLDGSRGFHGKGQTVQRRSNFENIPRSKHAAASPAAEDILTSGAGSGPREDRPSDFEAAALTDSRSRVIARPARSDWPEETRDTVEFPRYVAASVPTGSKGIGGWGQSSKFTYGVRATDSVFENGAAPMPFSSSDEAGRLSGLFGRRSEGRTAAGADRRVSSSAPNRPASEAYDGFNRLGANTPIRYLSRRIDTSPKLSPHDLQMTDGVPPPSQTFTPGGPAMFNDRFVNWIDTGAALAPLAPHRASPPAEDNRPRGIFSGEPMPVYPVPPPIFGFPEPGESKAEDWLMRLLAPRQGR